LQRQAERKRIVYIIANISIDDDKLLVNVFRRYGLRLSLCGWSSYHRAECQAKSGNTPDLLPNFSPRLLFDGGHL